MFTVIKAHRDGVNWISGIFDSNEDLDIYWQSIPDNLKPYQHLYNLNSKNGYPLYILETGLEVNQFKFVERSVVIDAIKDFNQRRKHWNLNEAENFNFFNLYIVFENYIPGLPGEDQMSTLKHFHISLFFLNSIENDSEFSWLP